MGGCASQPVLDHVQALVQSGGANLAAAGEPARAAYAALQAFFPGALAAKTITPENIQVALLLAQPDLNRLLIALSIGSVFFGANTYIGNGPNFMVKAIAQHQRVHTPSFLGYILRYTLPCMLPMLLVVWWVFFRAGH
jgi:Na+/H+ antiporter NhaD/arsenite permease-like protein